MKHGKKAVFNWKLTIIIISIIVELTMAFLIYLYFQVIFKFVDDKVLNFFSGISKNTNEDTVLIKNGNDIGEDHTEIIIEKSLKEDDCILNSQAKVIWSGLGMMISQTGTNEEYDLWIDALMAQGFTGFREVPSYQTLQWVEQSKAALLRNIPKGAKYIWGVSSNKYDNPNYVITAENWPTFRQAILDAAQWAQDNRVYEFQIGNEEEYHIDGTTITVDQIIANLKSVAIEAQEIFTRGNISYSCGHNYISKWVATGKGDIDLLASNVYMEYGSYKTNLWKTEITELVNAFGPDGTYLTEWGLNSASILEYSTDEAVQAAGVAEMLDYIEASGIPRAIFFCLKDDKFGIIKSDGTCRIFIWDTLTIAEKSEVE